MKNNHVPSSLLLVAGNVLVAKQVLGKLPWLPQVQRTLNVPALKLKGKAAVNDLQHVNVAGNGIKLPPTTRGLAGIPAIIRTGSAAVLAFCTRPPRTHLSFSTKGHDVVAAFTAAERARGFCCLLAPLHGSNKCARRNEVAFAAACALEHQRTAVVARATRVCSACDAVGAARPASSPPLLDRAHIAMPSTTSTSTTSTIITAAAAAAAVFFTINVCTAQAGAEAGRHNTGAGPASHTCGRGAGACVVVVVVVATTAVRLSMQRWQQRTGVATPERRLERPRGAKDIIIIITSVVKDIVIPSTLIAVTKGTAIILALLVVV